MSIYIFGDSHGHYLFARAGAATLCCEPGHTMHRAGRDGLTMFRNLVEPKASDDVILTFGEIDVRSHLLRRPAITGRTLQAEITDLVRRYMAAVSAYLDTLESRPRITVMGVVPPIEPLVRKHALPVVGTLPERLFAWFLLNEALRAGARDAGYTFVPIPRAYQARDGSLKRHLSDGQAHIAKDCTELAIRAVERALGKSLAFRPLPAQRHLVRSAMRRVAIVNGD